MDVNHVPGLTEFVPVFFMIKGEAVRNVRYDEFHDSTNGFREVRKERLSAEY